MACLPEVQVSNEVSKEGGISWAVCRDPLDRFKSSLAYDMKENSIEITEASVLRMLKNPDSIREYVYGRANYPEAIGFKGWKMRHAMSQTHYLFDNNIDILVRIEDLDTFLLMHFPGKELPLVHINIGQDENKRLVHKVISENPMVLNNINMCLAADYYTLERFKNTDKVWHWANGRIF
jgi:hypothetical protein